MHKRVYNNATVYITKPTEEQIANIKTATEAFIKVLVRKGYFKDERRRNNRRTSVRNTNTRKRNK